MQILTFPEAATPVELRTQVGEIQEQAWPSEPGVIPRLDAPVHDPALRPRSMLLLADGTVLAALDILTKEITHAGRGYVAGGLSTVVTHREARGRGHGRRLVAAAREALATDAYDLGLFTCDRPLRAFYESAGWHHLPDTVLVGGTPQAPFPSDRPGFDKVTMADFFSPRARRDRASFRGSRIALHSGDIDKLW
ncbi:MULTISPECIES: GNAT family N-acetyltransferase [unclassified Streptomyces]|uniref:GNAT family N-acetyltransferase n=1 Tax=unclassified Streptomyces TaxID=2593676 RepID=UPI000C271944|nr:GNAT family N-acetyltransferase [Streptomyces sp. CB02959]PJN38676.1 GNAT family N-acetyltransferase [Streptomyces sp. CB02959]